MRLISIGDLVIDYYYDNGKLIAVDGGISVHNIIANLASMGLDTCVIGSCGTDIKGEIAIKSLKNLKVDISHIKKNPQISTRVMHINFINNDFTSKRRCPICGNKEWYEKDFVTLTDVLNKIKNDDMIVLAGINELNKSILDNCSNKAFIDIGYYNEFEKYKDQYIIDFFNRKFEIININERVDNYIKDRFHGKNIYNGKIVIITRGKNGAEFIYKNEKTEKKLTPTKEKDPNGAGDAFFASVIFDYLTDKNFDLDKAFKNATNLTSKVVSCLGARGHLHNLFEVEKEDDSCTCKSLILKRNPNN